ncbi:unnamed protein product [Blepharisma stoltei]|uniref:SAM domain-containing protein n=1 Tax=Blepharisma stoltei TaxID=1481888 RepID=A0AAU9J5V3_9CILI|nr:unnamed protein product [Blepharisma stoltei]
MTDYEQIQKACRLGDCELLTKILTKSPELINELDDKLGWPPLYRTVICGHYDATICLLKLGADSNIKSRAGDTPLHQAASNNQIKIAQILLKYKADPNAQQDDGDTPLHYASLKGHINMVRLLLKHQANPNTFNFSMGKTALHCGAESGVLSVVQALLSYNASSTIMDFSSKLPSAYTSNEEIIRLLNDPLQDLPDLNYSDNEGNSLIEIVQVEEVKKEENSSPEPQENPSPADKMLYPQRETFSLEPIEEIRVCTLQDIDSPPFAKDTPVFEEGNISRPESVLEPECERSSTISGIHVNQSARNFSFGKDMSKNSLFRWLSNARLEFLFGPLFHSGYDDLDFLVEQMKSNDPITTEMLRSIGINKPGHRTILLALLEEESNPKRRKSVTAASSSSAFGCCAAPNFNPGINVYPSLDIWLESINLSQLLKKFHDSGYDDIDHLMLLMSSNYPITDETLKNDIKIDKLGHRHRILAKLKQDSNIKAPHKRNVSNYELSIEKETRSVACERCNIM